MSSASPSQTESRSRWVSPAVAARILNKSTTQVYRYLELGILHATNTLPLAMRNGRKKRTNRIALAEVLELKRQIDGEAGE